jgi:hypothetical protein
MNSTEVEVESFDVPPEVGVSTASFYLTSAGPGTKTAPARGS